jgi:hypothetical protein
MAYTKALHHATDHRLAARRSGKLRQLSDDEFIFDDPQRLPFIKALAGMLGLEELA